MPCIQTKVNVKLSQETERSIKAKLGEAVALIPGKSENWLMLTFEDQCRIWFRGEDSAPAAFVEVKIYGKAPGTVYDKLTARITEILDEELGIAADHIYVKYEEVAHWGWNGSNF